MIDNLKYYLDNIMVTIPKGKEQLRHYRDENKWISSDSQMSIPGQKGNLTEINKTVDIESFQLAKHPVTKIYINL